MPTRNVDLVDRLVKSGRYQNASEVLRDGLRMVEVQEAEDRARLKALREAARVGIADLDAGRYQSFASAGDLDEYFTSLTRDKIAARRSRSVAK